MKARAGTVALLLSVAAFICCAYIFAGSPRQLMRAVDRILPGEPIKDAWGNYYWKENWANAEPIDPVHTDVRWLRATRGREIWIAHALGASATAEANTLNAMRSAISHGFTFFEVDLWFDQDGRLRCYHGDDGGTPPPSFRAGDCTFEQVVSLLASDSWLVLDIKSDFQRTGAEIVRRVRVSESLSRRLIFQLYHPDDLAAFVRWSREVPLAAPIVTTYSAHRSVRHISAHLASLNVHAMTVPINLLSQGVPTSVQVVLTHPVHNCRALAQAKKDGARGFYTLTSLRC
jgi:glycerophosphoryl diester phosphodiesterase